MNLVTLIGNLGQDPELRYTQSQKAVCNLSVATRGRNPDEADWHRVTVWDKNAENCSKYLRKGMKVALRGSVNYRKFTNKQGQEQVQAVINAYEVEFLERPQGQVNQGSHQAPNTNFPRNSASPDDIPF